jgi:hypothetical protein
MQAITKISQVFLAKASINLVFTVYVVHIESLLLANRIRHDATKHPAGLAGTGSWPDRLACPRLQKTIYAIITGLIQSLF